MARQKSGWRIPEYVTDFGVGDTVNFYPVRVRDNIPDSVMNDLGYVQVAGAVSCSASKRNFHPRHLQVNFVDGSSNSFPLATVFTYQDLVGILNIIQNAVGVDIGCASLHGERFRSVPLKFLGGLTPADFKTDPYPLSQIQATGKQIIYSCEYESTVVPSGVNSYHRTIKGENAVGAPLLVDAQSAALLNPQNVTGMRLASFNPYPELEPRHFLLRASWENGNESGIIERKAVVSAYDSFDDLTTLQTLAASCFALGYEGESLYGITIN